MRYGFSLFELLIYLAVSSIIGMITCSWISSTINSNRYLHHKSLATVQGMCIADCWTRDIIAAPPSAKEWIAQNQDHIEWRKGADFIAYQYKNNAIVRIARVYDHNKNRLFIKKSIVGRSITSCLFTLEKHNNCVIGASIEIYIKKGDTVHAYNRYVSIRNSA